MIPSRRRLLAAGLTLPFAADALAQSCARTLSQTEGPFFKTDTPLRTSFLEKDARTRLVVSGQVLSAQCRPFANALLEFWHADEFGEYDNKGYRYRGHQHADAQGRYRLETIVPAEYPGRARHIHVKVQAPGGRVLTTQLYFPDEPGNRRDGIYRPELEMKIAKPGEGVYDFVVEA
ncbi:MAG TPA: intradiol ring-cleavage dioxygenase [Burkholderiales bacterium]|nr:intradiol ring-cleavage dioxygenase [Burkholderiales bacterium]